MMAEYQKMLVECLELQKGASKDQLKILKDLEVRIRNKIKEKSQRPHSDKFENYIMEEISKKTWHVSM